MRAASRLSSKEEVRVPETASSCRGYVMRVSTSCSLQNLVVCGPGVVCNRRWKFRNWGLVEVHGGSHPAMPVSVNMVNVSVQGGLHGNGMRLLGAVNVCMRDCSASNCAWNGVIVAVCTCISMISLFFCFGGSACSTHSWKHWITQKRTNQVPCQGSIDMSTSTTEWYES